MSMINLRRARILNSDDIVGGAVKPSNKRMQLTKLVAAPERQDKVPPRARAARTDAGTASQLIRGVLRTRRPARPGSMSLG
jgi:hypothetical protein